MVREREKRERERVLECRPRTPEQERAIISLWRGVSEREWRVGENLDRGLEFDFSALESSRKATFKWKSPSFGGFCFVFGQL